MPHMVSNVNERRLPYDTFPDSQKTIYASPTPGDLFFSRWFSHTEHEDPDLRKRARSWVESTGALSQGKERRLNNDSWNPRSPGDSYSCFWGKNWFHNLSNASDHGYVNEVDRTENPEPPIWWDDVEEKQRPSPYDCNGSLLNDSFVASRQSADDCSGVRNGKRVCSHVLDELELCERLFGCSQIFVSEGQGKGGLVRS